MKEPAVVAKTNFKVNMLLTSVTLEPACNKFLHHMESTPRPKGFKKLLFILREILMRTNYESFGSFRLGFKPTRMTIINCSCDLNQYL